MGVDIGSGGDYSCYTVFKIPGRLRKFLRKIRLDRSTWEFKVVAQNFVTDAGRKAK